MRAMWGACGVEAPGPGTWCRGWHLLSSVGAREPPWGRPSTAGGSGLLVFQQSLLSIFCGLGEAPPGPERAWPRVFCRPVQVKASELLELIISRQSRGTRLPSSIWWWGGVCGQVFQPPAPEDPPSLSPGWWGWGAVWLQGVKRFQSPGGPRLAHEAPLTCRVHTGGKDHQKLLGVPGPTHSEGAAGALDLAPGLDGCDYCLLPAKLASVWAVVPPAEGAAQKSLSVPSGGFCVFSGAPPTCLAGCTRPSPLLPPSQPPAVPQHPLSAFRLLGSIPSPDKLLLGPQAHLTCSWGPSLLPTLSLSCDSGERGQGHSPHLLMFI